MHRFKSRLKVRYTFGKKGNTLGEQWLRYRRGFYSCLLWWIIGAGIGLLFAASLTSEMKQTLAQHLQSSVSNLLDENAAPFTYFLKRCLTYTQLLLVIWGFEYFSFGYIGVRILMLVRGFIYGFSQTAWIVAYGFKGIIGGLAAYCPHGLLFTAVAAWVEWIMQRNIALGRPTMRQIAICILLLAVIIAWTEAYGAPVLFRACM